MEPVACVLNYSGRGRAVVFALALATGAVVFATPLPVLLRAAVLAWVGGVGCLALRSLGRWQGLRLAADGAVEVCDLDGTWHAGQVRAGSFVLPALTIVRWRPRGSRFDRTVLLLPGMVDPDAFRRVRIALRWEKP